MNPLSSVRVLEASVEFVEQPFYKPLQLSSGTITRITEARVCVRVGIDGCVAEGRGSIYLSDLWAWPDPARSHDERDSILRDFCTKIAERLPEWCGMAAHPLELGMQLHHQAAHHDLLPALATAMCASPFDAAIHDAAGQALGISAFRFYDQECPVPSADNYFEDDSAIRAVRELLLPEPAVEVPGWYVVSNGDDLGKDFADWIKRGYSKFKIKTLGRSAEDDSLRTVRIFERALECGAKSPILSIDSNEGNADAASVMDYLRLLRAKSFEAFDALQYLEQPTGRDITLHPFDWREVGQVKPVLLDEGLTSLSLLPLAREQGWSGLALKTCKGHSFALCAGAWAHQNGMLLAIQDLTNPGLSAIHSCLFAAHVPSINGVELNSLQFTPAANQDWMPRLAGLFGPRDGRHRLPDMNAPGLGSGL